MAILRLTDDLGRTVTLPRSPVRIVSLVPSDTYSVWALGVGERVVGRTRYCVEPAAAASAHVVGGTKDVDVDQVLALEPDLVLANQEENGRAALEALAGRVPILVALPRRVAAGFAHLARLARALGVESHPVAKALLARAYRLAPAAAVVGRACAPIWDDPLMTFCADTYGHDALAFCGVGNAFGDRPRLYPLAADLGKAPAVAAGLRDERYPRFGLEELAARAPDRLVFADEPCAWTDAAIARLAAVVPTARVVRVSGKDLFWHGAWAVDGLPRLARALEAA